MRSRPWTEERIGLLQRLWSEGKTAVEIAAALGEVSRSAVLGMIFRLRLGAQDQPLGKKSAESKAGQTAAPAKVPSRRNRRRQKKPLADVPRNGPKTVFELTNKTCRWPLGRIGGTHFFCGVHEADLECGMPYCAPHMRRAYLIPPAGAAQVVLAGARDSGSKHAAVKPTRLAG
jgi:GcrA cell cycle regulator